MIMVGGRGYKQKLHIDRYGMRYNHRGKDGNARVTIINSCGGIHIASQWEITNLKKLHKRQRPLKGRSVVYSKIRRRYVKYDPEMHTMHGVSKEYTKMISLKSYVIGE